VNALPFSATAGDSDVRPVVHRRAAVVDLVDRVVGAQASPCSERRDHIVLGTTDGILRSAHGTHRSVGAAGRLRMARDGSSQTALRFRSERRE
jgi:hypothetical protein